MNEKNQEKTIEEIAIEAYFDYYGKDATIPSEGRTEVTKNFVKLYNINGLLATYDRRTGEFEPKYT